MSGGTSLNIRYDEFGNGLIKSDRFDEASNKQVRLLLFQVNETAQYVRRTLGGVRGRNDR